MSHNLSMVVNEKIAHWRVVTAFAIDISLYNITVIVLSGSCRTGFR